MAIGLDRSHDGRVVDVTATTDRGRLLVDARSRDGLDLSLERYAATERSNLLASELGLEIVVSVR